MRLTERLRAALLRWDRLILALGLALPVLISSTLGFLWLNERGWLLWFALGTAGFYALLRGFALLARWRARRGGGALVPERELASPPPDPDWSEAERAAYQRARARIAQRVRTPIPWDSFPAEALATVEAVAADMSGGQRSALDFTLPEALLLIDQVALRYRSFLLRNLPYSDRLSVRTMHWLWRKQDAALTAWETGFLAWRGVRLVLNPAVGLVREAERLLSSGLQDSLTDSVRRDAQAILLEEAAQAAVDLYSGRLRFTEAELAARRKAPEVPLAPEEDALEIVLVGQSGAGKSTLLNALMGEDVAETDAAPSTGMAVAHEWREGVHLIDTPGLDGGNRRLKEIAARMEAADLVLWVHRANRPGRAPDVALAEAFAARMARLPERRPPPVVHVANAADLLLPDWPRPEHHLSAADRARLDAACTAIGTEMARGGPMPPVLALRAEAPAWNLDPLRAALDAALPEARMVRRNRLRLTGGEHAGIAGNLRRAGHGLGALAGAVTRRWRK